MHIPVMENDKNIFNEKLLFSNMFLWRQKNVIMVLKG